MSRNARKMSNSGFYHVIVRGIGKQIIFEEQSDYLFYLNLLIKITNDIPIKINAFCLMNNHIHFLLFDEYGNLSKFMQKIGSIYAAYFNNKYHRTGYLYQGRFFSEPVNSDAQLLTVFKYILKNPEKAGICRASEYEWSSYRFYNVVQESENGGLKRCDPKTDINYSAKESDKCTRRACYSMTGNDYIENGGDSWGQRRLSPGDKASVPTVTVSVSTVTDTLKEKTEDCIANLVDTSLISELIGSYESYVEFIDDNGSYDQDDYKTNQIDDEDAKNILMSLGIQHGFDLKKYPFKERDEIIRKLRASGLSIRQIERLTGISRGVIQRVV